MGQKHQGLGDVLGSEPRREIHAAHPVQGELTDDQIHTGVRLRDRRIRRGFVHDADAGVPQAVAEQIRVAFVGLDMKHTPLERFLIDALGDEQLAQRVGIDKRAKVDLVVETDTDFVNNTSPVLAAHNLARDGDGSPLGVRKVAHAGRALVQERAVQEPRAGLREVPAGHRDFDP